MRHSEDIKWVKWAVIKIISPLKQFKIEQTELSTYFENVHYLLTNLEPNQIDRLQRDMFKKSLFKFEKQHSHFFVFWN